MQKITLIGLGAMGQALAQAQLEAGYEVTVWNRSAAKADTLVENGARLADTLADAIAASEAVLICLSDYASSYAILDQPGVAELIEGRIII